jgi:hypothetical protein
MLTCLYCDQGDVSVEVFGFAVHKLADRWVTCVAKTPNSPFERALSPRATNTSIRFPVLRSAQRNREIRQKILRPPDRHDPDDTGYPSAPHSRAFCPVQASSRPVPNNRSFAFLRGLNLMNPSF